jgi:hypothetical protein
LIEAFENSDYGRISMKAPTQEEIKLIEQEINESNDKLIT